MTYTARDSKSMDIIKRKFGLKGFHAMNINIPIKYYKYDVHTRRV